jgi:DNA-binding protein H-NS
MGTFDLKRMNFQELWALHQELTKILAKKINAEKDELEKRLSQLNSVEQDGSRIVIKSRERPRRKYPRVIPKYFNPSVPTETWSGRGKQPRWLVAALKFGHKLEEFRIVEKKGVAESPRRGRRS